MSLYVALSFLIGLVTGAFVSVLIRRRTHAEARMIIDTSNPEKDVFKLDVFDLDALSKKKYLEVKIIHNSLK